MGRADIQSKLSVVFFVPSCPTTAMNQVKKHDHLARVLKQNGYPANFICNASAPPTQETADVSSPEEEQGKGPLVVIP